MLWAQCHLRQVISKAIALIFGEFSWITIPGLLALVVPGLQQHGRVMICCVVFDAYVVCIMWVCGGCGVEVSLVYVWCEPMVHVSGV